jgi:hypothetical protein
MKLLAAFNSKKEVHEENLIVVAVDERERSQCFGLIAKRGKHASSLKDRWFVLMDDGVLHYFEDSASTLALGTIFLQDGAVFTKETGLLHASLTARLSLTAKKASLEVHRDRTYHLEFKSTHDLKDWTRALTATIAKYAEVPVVRMEGYLDKRGHLNVEWTRRWFQCCGPLLLYRKDINSKETLGFMLLSGSK